MLEARIAAGGFGVVFRARQVHEGRDLGPVALKFLRHGRDTPIARYRLANELLASRMLVSPHMVRVHHLDRDEKGRPFLVMELLDGLRLRQLLWQQGRLSPGQVLAIGRQVARALAECHEAGIVHRDLKPENLFLIRRRGEDLVKVIDLGIARVPGSEASTIFGTPDYAAPEFFPAPADGRSDIYSLGRILYECLAGDLPGDDADEDKGDGETARPSALRKACPELPGPLEELLECMTARQVEQRPPSMADVIIRLEAIEGPPSAVAPAGAPRSVTGLDLEAATEPLDPAGTATLALTAPPDQQESGAESKEHPERPRGGGGRLGRSAPWGRLGAALLVTVAAAAAVGVWVQGTAGGPAHASRDSRVVAASPDVDPGPPPDSGPPPPDRSRADLIPSSPDAQLPQPSSPKTKPRIPDTGPLYPDYPAGKLLDASTQKP